MKILAIALLSFIAASPLYAQQRPAQQRAVAPASEPDVVLDVPDLSVDSIALDVENLDVHLALDARVANLVKLTAGADAGIDNVKLEIVGVEAEAYLVVRLDRVADIVERALKTIDENPEIITRLLQTVDRTVGTVGDIANTTLQPGGVVSQTVGTVGRTLDNVTAPEGLLSQTVNTLGQTVQRTVDTTGRIVERTVDTAGKVVGDRTLGRVADLPLIRETTNAAGQTVRRVRDTSGAIIEYTIDRAGKVLSSRIVRE
ncbi:MAG TPA: hypothetical protein VFT12_13730 [Thermoanaerobaculia bacterium]|nr:hypothetical protein [Thermoanaerobaculia bacterium]